MTTPGLIGGRDHFNEFDLDAPEFAEHPHRCVGAHVARLQMVTALDVLLRRLPDLAVAAGEKPVYSNSGVARSMDRLPLVFTPGHRSVSAE